MLKTKFRAVLLVLLVLWQPLVMSQEPDVFARVNGVSIMNVEYESALHVASRERFFHADVDSQKLDDLKVDVAWQLIDRQVLLAAAAKKKLEPAADKLAANVKQELQRYRVETLKPAQRQRLQALIEKDVSERLVLDQLKRRVQNGVVVSDKQLRAYYDEHLDKFTTPEQLRISVILLRVDPSASPAVWQAAHDEALRIKEKLDKGGDFALLASIHSSDNSADKGGDLGFVHTGMLSKEAQRAVDNLPVGDVSDVAVLLQGVALFKLTARTPPVINSFEEVKDRAKGLYLRQAQQQAWEQYIKELRQQADVEVFDPGIKKLM